MEIIRTERHEANGVVDTSVYGINLFSANNISTYDAIYEFVKLLALRGKCCLLVGGLCLEDVDDSELQLRLSLYSKVSTSDTGIHGGRFYNLRDMSQNFERPSLLITNPGPEVFELEAEALEYAVRCDALAVMRLLPATDFAEVQAIVNSSVKSHMDHVLRLCNCLEILAYTESDGFSFELWSQASRPPALIDELLHEITRLITARPEFRNLEHNMYFDDANDWCLKVRKDAHSS